MSVFKCPKCCKTTGGNEAFCTDCGQPLNIKCPACGETWRYMFVYNYCPACGHNMEPVDAEEKLKEELKEEQSTPSLELQLENLQNDEASQE